MSRPVYSREYEREAAQLVLARSINAAQAVKDLDIHAIVLRKWVRDFGSSGSNAFHGNSQLKPDDEDRSVLASRGGVVNEGCHDSSDGDRCPDDGDLAHRSATRNAASPGLRQSINQRALALPYGSKRCDMPDEPFRNCRGQCGNGKPPLIAQDQSREVQYLPHQQSDPC
jgi:hypothetical protein